jgi:hypothetical protein
VTLEHRGVPSAAAEEPSRLLAKIRSDLLDLDRGRHVPERIEDDFLHLIGEDRRLLVRLADHHARRVHGLAVSDDTQRELGDVDRYVVRTEVVRQPAPALHVDQDGSDLG